MGFLLLQYEFQRASREVSVHQRAGIRLDNQVIRYTKRIENMQSVFQKAGDRLEKNYAKLSNLANNSIQGSINAAAASGANAQALFQGTLNGIVVGGVSLGSIIQVGGLSADASEKDILSALSNAAAQAKATLSEMIENAAEADKERLQAQQDEQLQPISEKEADLQARKTLEDTLCDLWTTRRDNAKQHLGQDVKESMAGYGLG